MYNVTQTKAPYQGLHTQPNMYYILTTAAEPHRPKQSTKRRFTLSPITPLRYRPCVDTRFNDLSR